MQSLVKEYNSDTFNVYKPYIISLKSKQILEYLNCEKSSIHESIGVFNEYNKILLKVSKECYNKFNPSMIYTFNDEIHMVFYNILDYADLYNGNINKTITIITSFATRVFTKEFMNSELDFDFTIGAKYVEFENNYEVLNYLIWRQLDCKRNNIITLYRYNNLDVKNMSLEDIRELLLKYLQDINIDYLELNYLIYGNIIKKELVYIYSKDKCISYTKDKCTSYTKDKCISIRKEFTISHELLKDNFKENLRKYIYNRYL
jgi:tRNA(His) 5'-end guanylyltransferase